MYKKSGFWISLISALIALALLGGVAYLTYQVGFNQGILASEHVDLQEFPAPPMPMSYFHRPFGFGGLLIGMAFLFLVLGMVRRAFFFSAWHHCGPHGPMHPRHPRFMRHPYWGAWEMDDEEPEQNDVSEEEQSK